MTNKNGEQQTVNTGPIIEINEPPKSYGPVAAVIITIFVYIAAQLVAGLLIALFPLARGWSMDQTNNWIQNNVWATFAFVVFVEAITLWLLYIFLKRYKMNFRNLGLNTLRLNHIGLAAGGFAVYFVLYIIGIIVVKALIPGLDVDQKQEIGFSTSATGISLLPVFISLVILPPITEEIAARGFLFGGLRTKLPFMLAAVITSIMFAAAHLGASSDGLLWVAGVDTFILSMVLCYLRETSGSLWPSIGVHMIKNGLAFIILFNIIQYFR